MDGIEFAIKAVCRLKPGQEVKISSRQVQSAGIPRFAHNGFEFDWPDQVLESIVGSSFQFGYTHDEVNRAVVFFRLPAALDDERRTYVSPDQRSHYRREGKFFIPAGRIS